MKSTNKKIKLFFAITIACLIGVISCKDPDVYGYLSDTIRYVNNPWTQSQGTPATSQGVTLDNSTPPLNVTLADIRDAKTGLRAEAFYKKYPSYTWKDSYDPTKDTTLELINAKRVLSEVYPLQVLPATGQVVLSDATKYIEMGEYLLDINIQNSAGKKDYPELMKLKLVEPKIEFINAPYFMAVEGNSETTIPFAYYSPDIWLDNSKGLTPSVQMTVTQKSATDAQKTYQEYSRINFIIQDKNGNPFPGKAIQDRPSGNSFLKNFRTFANKTTVKDYSILYEFGVLPFPAPYWEPQSNGTNCYYRIYPEYIASIDTVTPSTYLPPHIPDYGTWDKRPVKLNVRFNLKIYEPGDYDVILKLRATRKE